MQVQSSTIVNDTGKILLFGFQHFIDEIVKGDCCFICGAKRGSKHFNDEHIIPDWVLKRFNLHAKCVNLTNATQFRYGQYKVPCCKDCNTELGKYYEEPISNLLSKPYREVVQDVLLAADLNSKK